MELSLFDLHCDTAGEMLRQAQGFEHNTLAVSLEKAKKFQKYIQVMAHWTPYRLSDEDGWSYFERMLQNLKHDPAIAEKKTVISTACPTQEHSPTLLLAVEDVRILSNRLERVDTLYQRGVRIVTPLWKGQTSIGGSHDTDDGLTAFGKQALRHAAELGILLDVSHASVRSTDEILAISAEQHRPVIASHSNAYEVCPVSRNLRSEQIRAIIEADGLIGLNLYKSFLKEDGNATLEDALRHVEYFLELGAQEHLALGCDMDGCDLPPDVPDLSALPRLAEKMQDRGYSEELIHAIFYQNAYRFARTYLCN